MEHRSFARLSFLILVHGLHEETEYFALYLRFLILAKTRRNGIEINNIIQSAESAIVN